MPARQKRRARQATPRRVARARAAHQARAAERRRRLRIAVSFAGGLIILLVLAALTPGARSYLAGRYGGGDTVRRVPVNNATARVIVAAAHAQVGTFYNPDYQTISYPNGDVPHDRGACTDVVVRALRGAKIDLQQLIHEDKGANFAAYPDPWNLKHADSNIDHRRVPNQMRFFQRRGLTLPTAVTPPAMAIWQPGDFVYWDTGTRQHTGVLSDGVGRSGLPLVIHNGSICVEQDCLKRWKIIGHYRYPVAGKPLPMAKAKPTVRKRAPTVIRRRAVSA